MLTVFDLIPFSVRRSNLKAGELLNLEVTFFTLRTVAYIPLKIINIPSSEDVFIYGGLCEI